MLPGVDGFGVCRTLRQQGNNTPVLFLTARGDPADRIRGLESGGDDYLAKPFHLQEFLLRVRAILRRWDWYRGASATADTAVLRFGFGTLGLHKVHVGHFGANAASRALIQRLGFRPIGIQRQEFSKDGVWHDQHLYEMLDEEFSAQEHDG